MIKISIALKNHAIIMSDTSNPTATVQEASNLIRLFSLETFLDTVLECITPLLPPRINSGIADLKAAIAIS